MSMVTVVYFQPRRNLSKKLMDTALFGKRGVKALAMRG